MDFLGMGPMELAVILVIAMVFLGPQKIVQAASQVGKALHEFRKASTQLTNELTKELVEDEPKKTPPQPAPAPLGARSRSDPIEPKPAETKPTSGSSSSPH